MLSSDYSEEEEEEEERKDAARTSCCQLLQHVNTSVPWMLDRLQLAFAGKCEMESWLWGHESEYLDHFSTGFPIFSRVLKNNTNFGFIIKLAFLLSNFSMLSDLQSNLPCYRHCAFSHLRTWIEKFSGLPRPWPQTPLLRLWRQLFCYFKIFQLSSRAACVEWLISVSVCLLLCACCGRSNL